MDSDVLDWSELPLEPLLCVFKYLLPKDLVSVSKVNNHWHSAADRDELWRPLCAKDWVLDSKRDGKNFKQTYGLMHVEFAKYRPCYVRVRRAWNTIEAFLAERAPRLLACLAPGATEEDISLCEKLCRATFDLETRLSYRIHNGQAEPGADFVEFCGVFGGYKFYDQHVNVQLCSLTEMVEFYEYYKARPAPAWMRFSAIVAKSPSSRKRWFVVLQNRGGGYDAGRIVEPSEDYQRTFPVASSFGALLEEYAAELTSGNFIVTPKRGEINRFPRKRNVSRATTRGVTVECMPLFVAESSMVRPPTYFFAYRIRMTMPQSASAADWCKLQRRHWYIDRGDMVEEVEGEGVIGKFPEMFPGAEFEYASCCPLPGPTGSMRGTFQMVTRNGETFDLEVPLFRFVALAPVAEPPALM
eukprot:TRINITY_DN5869_c0_g1_i2.p2 TRINITY_DN5869_c0_g1~~TRINITY_DN5869_c0_g1_i2.p2  ORF type:complete len:413 (-),score=111.11 TRINITY_DN5869_c0_g1_i2:189-1427(-)